MVILEWPYLVEIANLFISQKSQDNLFFPPSGPTSLFCYVYICKEKRIEFSS